MLTANIKGAFDSILPGRLVRRLREQGWFHKLVQWVASFTTNRKIRIRLDSIIGSSTNVDCGLPQGSPVSPILFMLYIAPLFSFGKPGRRFGYADDIALLAISRSLEENTASLTRDLQEALTWGSSVGIIFDPDKSELLHSSQRRNDHTPKDTPPVSIGALTITENHLRPYLRWLGVLFDKKLTFKWHTKAQAAKALKISKALSSLSNTCRGVLPILLRRAASTCALPIAYVTAETWWPSRTRPGPKDSISNKVESHL